MSLLREVMGEAQSVINDVLGHACTLTNSDTQQEQSVQVVIQNEVELYQNHQFVGVVTTGVFDRSVCGPMIGDQLYDIDTDTTYLLEGVKSETPAKVEFVMGER